MRGQAHTLEGFVAALIVLSGVVFALQATAVTPLTASTSNQHIENQQRAVATDLLAGAAARDELVPTALYWNATAGGFRAAGDDGVYASGGPPTRLGETLNETFRENRIAFNLAVEHRDANASRSRTRVIDMGEPTDNAVSSTRTVAVFDDDELDGGDAGGCLGGDDPTLANVTSEAGCEFYAVDADSDGPLFNVLEVRLTIWRI